MRGAPDGISFLPRMQHSCDIAENFSVLPISRGYKIRVLVKGGCAGVAGVRGLCGVLCIAAYSVDMQGWVLGFRHQLTRSYH